MLQTWRISTGFKPMFHQTWAPVCACNICICLIFWRFMIQTVPAFPFIFFQPVSNQIKSNIVRLLVNCCAICFTLDKTISRSFESWPSGMTRKNGLSVIRQNMSLRGTRPCSSKYRNAHKFRSQTFTRTCSPKDIYLSFHF